MRQIIFLAQKLTKCTDDSCEDCRKDEATLYRVINCGFSRRNLVEVRHRHIKHLIVDKNDVYKGFVFVVGVTASRLEYFQSWACYAEKNGGFNPRDVIYVVAVKKASLIHWQRMDL